MLALFALAIFAFMCSFACSRKKVAFAKASDGLDVGERLERMSMSERAQRRVRAERDRRQEGPGPVLRMMLQVNAVLGTLSGYKISGSSVIKEMIGTVSTIFAPGAAPSSSLSPVTCILQPSYFQKFYATLLAPVVSVVLIVMMTVTVQVCIGGQVSGARHVSTASAAP